ncbi:four helix bundle protein [Tenacibaculum todarodis]|uniref:Four helix bundle protein n=1 Tax=Tenacibaculum todarodis TaxID=1850252 RepID=A0A1L3JJW4_9FLAO|nr:four helix bundle protein [Tenacibaculum todarodis]APG65383.1 four helix bundle protein [Tenacibaculum todarodis]
MSKTEFVELLKKRTKQLALDVILLYDNIKKTDSTRVIGRQLIRSVTSVAANYRAACIARSQREFFSKMSIVVEEADETLFWLEMLKDAGFVSNEKIEPLMDEALQILKIVSKARKSAGNN